jgi:hypothetical protein
VCDSPTWLMVIGSKEAVMDGIANFDNRANHTFAETLFVAYLFEESNTANENDLMTKDLDLEDGT